ncbi:hypothetical protein [Bacillus sp. AFS017336]|uniref:hypothetical protein n=1 Tax=Bacillus sp. AFS017336 TaxID=2033489 RepID=UPI000BEF79F9|nr:hypothetical protein [Bacillus sp. AFS017336]PEL04373.1 hypothetical protein CN601_21735 [Bacillus sp. AFS017336]
MVSINAIAGADCLKGGITPKLESTMFNGGIFYVYYETKDGRYFSVGSIEPQFRKLPCEGIKREDLIELSFSLKSEDMIAFKEEVKATFLTKLLEAIEITDY